ncbi:MAG: ABC transporter ATP-binding protein [Clostridia bacterium]|nr:ABC transporter ATP-binding protein [Clostridia bacterium]
MSDIAINVENVSKVYKIYDKKTDRMKDALGLSRKQLYKEHYALRDVSMQIKKGETLGIIGTNGSGKSTILKIITGLLNPTEGKVTIDGRISALLELGAGFNMEYTGIENVYLNGTMIGFTKEEIDAKLQGILDFADIGDFVNQPVKTYSSGMFVRLAFAVAINIDPEILIVDEALSVGDVFFQAKCYHKFEEFKKMGKTILFVSHDLSSIAQYCDRVVLLNRGVKVDEGTPKDMINLYKKILVGQSPADKTSDSDTSLGAPEGAAKAVQEINEGADDGGNVLWSSHFELNPDVNEYGNRKAEIIDFGILDENGMWSGNIEKGTHFTIKYKVRFNENVSDPILTYTIKDLKGNSITGSNTMYEKVNFGEVMAGEEKTIAFTQLMNLQGGEYLLSISCTGYSGGDFMVYHRLYDVLNFTVVSDKNTVGYYDMFSKVTVS